MTLTSCLGGQEERPWTCCASEPFESLVNLQLELSPQSPKPAGNSREREKKKPRSGDPPSLRSWLRQKPLQSEKPAGCGRAPLIPVLGKAGQASLQTGSQPA